VHPTHAKSRSPASATAAATSRPDHRQPLDPHTAAELSLDEIASLVDDLLREHGDRIPAFERVGTTV
jgi:hypothetical protein